MKTPRNLGLIAIVVFIISYFLPAFGDMSGFACFGYCWSMFLGHDAEILSGAWFYYSGFVISNILFIGLVVALFATTKIRRLRSVVSIVCFLQVLSWVVLFAISGKPSQVAELKIGYYVWLIAFVLLVATHLRQKSAESVGLDSSPARKGVPGAGTAQIIPSRTLTVGQPSLCFR
jgi:hypothetical protein